MLNKNIKINQNIALDKIIINLVGSGKLTYLWVGGERFFLGTIEGRELKQLALNILKRMEKK